MHASFSLPSVAVSATAVTGLTAALDKADAEVSRLKEWQDVFKRMADDKAQEAAQELQAFKTHAAERQVAAAGAATVHPQAKSSALRFALEQLAM
jgi:hypothetical protein